MKYLISIITVTLNNKNGIAKTLSSIDRQDFNAFEWIIIDGKSSDGTDDFIRKMASNNNFKLKWISEKDSGIYDAMNKGIMVAEGHYIVFLNAGDILYDTGTLSNIAINLHSTNKNIVFGEAILFYGEKLIHRKTKPGQKYIWHGLPANHQATYFPTKWLKSNLYDINFKICGDYYIVAKYISSGQPCQYIHSPLVKFEMGGTSFRNIKRQLFESYIVQKNILKVPYLLRIVSMARRLATILFLKIFFINAHNKP